MEVDEGTQLISKPGEGDLILAPACLEFFDAPIGEVHILGLAERYARAASIRARCCCR